MVHYWCWVVFSNYTLAMKLKREVSIIQIDQMMISKFSWYPMIEQDFYNSGSKKAVNYRASCSTFYNSSILGNSIIGSHLLNWISFYELFIVEYTFATSWTCRGAFQGENKYLRGISFNSGQYFRTNNPCGSHFCPNFTGCNGFTGMFSQNAEPLHHIQHPSIGWLFRLVS